jgi:hypothetical protein
MVFRSVPMIKNVLNILLLVLILTVSSGAAEMEEYHGPEITVRYEVPLKDAAIRLASAYGAARADIETKLGWRLQRSPVVVLVRDYDAFQETARNTLVTAFARPERNLIVIDYSKMNRAPFDLEDTFGHELSHILLHQEIDASSLPKWLDEGIAQWASGGIADILRSGEKDLLQQAVLSHRMIALKEITETFPASPNGLILAYEESKSFTEFIVKHYGEAKLRLILKSLGKNESIEEAVNGNLGLPLKELEQQWTESLSKENLWISYAAEHLYWLLFFFAALISIAGFCVAKRRMKNYRDEEDEQAEEGSDDQSGPG